MRRGRRRARDCNDRERTCEGLAALASGLDAPQALLAALPDRDQVGLDLAATLDRETDRLGVLSSGHRSVYSSGRIQRMPGIRRWFMATALRPHHLAGGCQCGAVPYEITGQPVSLYVCHCRACQKQSSSAFGISVIVKHSDFRVTRGEVEVWSRAADSGGTLACAFCPACGSLIWHEAVGATETISVKGGSMDEPRICDRPSISGRRASCRAC
jgi:hypothetical protein